MALLQIVPHCTLPIKSLMSPGCCCMCGLPVRDHTTHLCVDKTKSLVSSSSKDKQTLTLKHNEPGRIKRTPSPITTSTAGVTSKQYPRTVKHSSNAPSPHPSAPSTPASSPSPKPLPLIVEGAKPEVKVKEHFIKEEITPTEMGECQNTIVSRPTSDITPDIQLWLNTLSRSPIRKSDSSPAPLSVSPVIKTIAQNSPQNLELTSNSEREHKQAELKSNGMKLSERQTCIKDRLELLSKRILRYKTFHITKHILSQLDKFDEHALHTQVEPKHQLPCKHKLEYRQNRTTSRSMDMEPPVDGHAFSTMEKLRVNIGVETLREKAEMLSCFDDENTESSSDEEELEVLGDQSLERSELSAIEQRWEQERAQIAAQWTWIRGQYEDLQHRMRRETDLLQMLREKKEKVVLLHNDHYINDHHHIIGDKFSHHGGVIPPLNGYHTHPSLVMKTNFKYELSRANQEMYLKSNQHKRLNKSSKIDGNTCARTRPLASIIKRNIVQAKPEQKCITQKDYPIICGILGKMCCRKNKKRCSEQKAEAGFHPVLSKRSESHINVHLTPLLSSVDYFPNDRKTPAITIVEHKADTLKLSSSPISLNNQLQILPPTTTAATTSTTTPGSTVATTSSTPASLTPIFPDVPCISTLDIIPKKRGYPAATVEHMIKKYRPSLSQPGSRAASPIHMDKRKKLNQFDIHNIEVDFSVVAPARIEKPRYKEIEIPKFRIITDDLLNEMLKSETIHSDEEDSVEAYEILHSRCERLEKVRFINMTINATGRTDLISELQSVNTNNSNTANNNQSLARNKPHDHGMTVGGSSGGGGGGTKKTGDGNHCLLERCPGDGNLSSSLRSSASRSRIPSHRRADPPNSHVFDEEVKQRTRASKHTSEYPTAVS